MSELAEKLKSMAYEDAITFLMRGGKHDRDRAMEEYGILVAGTSTIRVSDEEFAAMVEASNRAETQEQQ